MTPLEEIAATGSRFAATNEKLVEVVTFWILTLTHLGRFVAETIPRTCLNITAQIHFAVFTNKSWRTKADERTAATIEHTGSIRIAFLTLLDHDAFVMEGAHQVSIFGLGGWSATSLLFGWNRTR